MRRIYITLVAAALALATFALYTSASAAGAELRARLNGAKEVDEEGNGGQGDPNGSGTARIRLLPKRDRMCFDLSWKGIAAPTAAHIHDASAGKNGPIVDTLFAAEAPLPSTINSVKGCISATDETLAHYRHDPDVHYVNIHNEEFPSGAIRGQLKRT